MTTPLLSQISRQRKLRLLQRYLGANDSILEVGAGSGWFTSHLRRQGYQVTALDLQEPADVIGDINQWSTLKLEAHSFDVIIALEVIEHVDCLEALCALCKPDGLILLSSPHPHWDWLMQSMEALHLTQKRTSPHTNLTDFGCIPLLAEIKQRPLGIHQVALFRNRALDNRV
ncbi:class I SAM-dependent methyltransferase [Planctomycetota bacterium]